MSWGTNGQLRSLFERIERLHEEKAAISDDIKEVFAEAKGNGFDTKAMKIVLQKRRMDRSERLELEAVVDLYMAELGMVDLDDDEPRAPAPARAREIIEEFGSESQRLKSEPLPDHDVETGEILDTSSHTAAAVRPGATTPSAGTGGEEDRQLTPHGDGDIADAASGDGPCMGADIAADEAEPAQVEASSVPANPDRPRRTLAEMRGVFAGEPRKRIQLVDDEPTEGGENVDPQVLGEVETHASPAINPDCAHPDTCQFATKSYCCSQCSSARSARLQAQRKVRA